MRTRLLDGDEQPTVGQWLRRQGQSADGDRAVLERDSHQRAGRGIGPRLAGAARKVLVDGFLAAREAYIVEIPEAPLGTLYGDRLADWLSPSTVSRCI